MIAAFVTDDLETRFHNNNDVGIAYLFCSFKPQYEQPEDLLADLIKQLVEEGSVPDNVMDLLNQCKSKGKRLSRDETSNGLSSVISSYSGIFVVIDALDECQGDCRTKFLEKMRSLQEKTEINNFATSRLIPEVVTAFEGKASLEVRASKEDVQEYLDGNLSRLPSFVQSSKSLQDEVKAEIGKAVDGMYVVSFLDQLNRLTSIRFLLAHLYMESLVGKKSIKEVNQRHSNRSAISTQAIKRIRYGVS